MAWNGSGTFVRLYSWLTDQANGVLVRADRMDADTNDIAAGFSNCLTRDGQGMPTANISWASFQINNLASGVASGDAVNFGQVFTNPVFTNPQAAADPTAGDQSQKLATTNWVAQLAFSTVLPGQANNGGRFLSTNGSTASWKRPVGSSLYTYMNVGGF